MTTGISNRGCISSSLKRASTTTLLYVPVGSTVTHQPLVATIRAGPDTTRQSTSDGEKLPFKVTEFNKGSKKITLSHTRTYEEVRREEARKEAREKESEANTTQKAVRKLKDNLERTTLGDISDLADLKSRLEAEEKANQE